MRQTKLANLQLEKKWYLVDATDLILGRMSTEVAKILTGRNKVTYTPQEDHGDYVIIINAKNIVLTGNKINDKMYYKHSGYPGGLKSKNAATLLKENPSKIIEKSIWGMVPHTKLGRKQYKKLFVYDGNQHKHEAQQPKEIKIK